MNIFNGEGVILLLTLVILCPETGCRTTRPAHTPQPGRSEPRVSSPCL